jgi:hypothetical protein
LEEMPFKLKQIKLVEAFFRKKPSIIIDVIPKLAEDSLSNPKYISNNECWEKNRFYKIKSAAGIRTVLWSGNECGFEDISSAYEMMKKQIMSIFLNTKKS